MRTPLMKNIIGAGIFAAGLPTSSIVDIPVVLNSSEAFGAKTLAGAGGLQLSATNSPTSWTITGGTAAAQYTIDTSGLVTPAVTNPAAGTLIVEASNAIGASAQKTITISALAGTFSVAASEAEITAGLTAATSGDRVLVRSGTISNPSGGLFRDYIFTSETIVEGESGFVVSLTPGHVGLQIFNSTYLTLKNFEVANDGADATTNTVILKGPNTDFSGLDGLKIHGGYRDPLGDYSAAGAYQNTPSGVQTQSSGGYPKNIFIRNCEIYDVKSGISVTADGKLDITDNMVYRTYSDPLNVSVYSNSTGILTAGVDVFRNVCFDMVGRPSDTDNPHIDFLQFLNSIGHWYNVRVIQNVFFQTANARGNDLQGIADFSGSATAQMTDIEVKGNIVLIDSSHGITINNINGGTIVGNLFAKWSPGVSGATTNITLGPVSSGTGTVFVHNNIAEATVYNATPVNELNTVLLGLNGVTNSYASVFDGPFTALDFAEILTQFSIKALGPADSDASGGPSIGDAGPVGSGYASYGNPMDNGTGWTLNSAYEPATDVPDAFTVSDWSIADAAVGGQLAVTITSLPFDNGFAISNIYYRVNGGSWVPTGGAVSFSITGLTDNLSYNVELQAVNSQGASIASDTKAATPTNGVYVPFFVVADGVNDKMQRTYGNLTASAQITASAKVNLSPTASGYNMVIDLGGRSEFRLNSSGTLNYTVKDNTNTAIATGTTTAAFTPGTEGLLVITIDLAPATPVFDIYIDGVTESPAIVKGSGLVDMSNISILSQYNSTADLFEGEIADVYWAEEAWPAASFIDGANYANPSGIGAPKVLIQGNAAVWNAGTNSGNGADFTVSGSFDDAV